MNWLQNHQVFLFDFDGLLVDTERLHMAAYVELCRRYECQMRWDFDRYCKEAHGQAMGIFQALRRDFPRMFEIEPKQEVLYEEKKKIYVDLLKTSRLELMPGAGSLLQALEENNVKRAVVTNSPRAHIEIIKEQLPLLKSVPLWLTREDYSQPKPSPEGYLKAIATLALPGDKVIGFEDSLKGLKSLVAAGVDSILISPAEYDHIPEALSLGAKHFESFDQYLTSAR